MTTPPPPPPPLQPPPESLAAKSALLDSETTYSGPEEADDDDGWMLPPYEISQQSVRAKATRSYLDVVEYERERGYAGGRRSMSEPIDCRRG